MALQTRYSLGLGAYGLDYRLVGKTALLAFVKKVDLWTSLATIFQNIRFYSAIEAIL